MENNNQDIKLCPSCGAKNKSAYKYCNECGALLNQTYYSAPDASNIPPMYNNVPNGQNADYNSGEADSANYNGQFSQSGYTPYSPFDAHTGTPYFGTPDFSGVSAKDVYEFTGEKPELFYKLKMQHFSGKNGPYCWPLFILGFLLDFFGIGCWYLYHKMYKPAIGFLALSFANVLLKCFAIFWVFDGITSEQVKAILNSPNNAYGILGDFLTGSNVMFINLINSATNIINFAAFVVTIVLPFYAYKQYKNHVIVKIYEQYSKSPLPNLAVAGGSSGGKVALVCLAYVIISLTALVISVFPFINATIKAITENVSSGKPGQHSEMPFDFPKEFPFEDGNNKYW